MYIALDKSYGELRKCAAVFAVITDIDLSRPPCTEAQELIDTATKRALSMSDDTLEENQILEGYRRIVRDQKRSLRKFPPTVEALVKNAQRKGDLPHINTAVDIYNAKAVETFLAIGAHDLDSIDGGITYTRATETGSFTPIGGGEKKVAIGDVVYYDDKGIMAWMDARDSELYKVRDDSTGMLLVIAGNENTSDDMRIDALNHVGRLICESCGGHFFVGIARVGQPASW